MDIGYIRVSGVDQNTVRQESAFDGLNLNKVFEDKASGKDVHRPALERCLEVLRDGDTLHVHTALRGTCRTCFLFFQTSRGGACL